MIGQASYGAPDNMLDATRILFQYRMLSNLTNSIEFLRNIDISSRMRVWGNKIPYGARPSKI